MNIELLLKVRDAILAEPLKFDMGSYASKNPESPCGTTACIAGWAVSIGRNHKNLKGVLRLASKDGIFGEWVPDTAIRLLQITKKQENSLFHRVLWPEPFCEEYKDAETAKDRSKIAAARIDHFIATGE